MNRLKRRSAEKLKSDWYRREEPPQPVQRSETIRRYIIALLTEHACSAKEISTYTKIPEKDIYEHLEHIRKSMNKDNLRLSVMPAQCNACGFVFKKRDRLKKPGKCPMCHSNLIHPPVFSISAGKDSLQQGIPEAGHQ